VAINEIEELIIRKRGRQSGAFLMSRAKQREGLAENVRDLALDSLVHGHQPGGVDGRTPRRFLRIAARRPTARWEVRHDVWTGRVREVKGGGKRWRRSVVGTLRMIKSHDQR